MTDWLQEHIPRIKNVNWLYQIVCFFMGKRKEKLTYEEMYLILYGLNRSRATEEKDAKEMAMLKVLEIYQYLHNNKLPKGVKV